MAQNNYEKATLGAGCFWCVEAIFQNLKGVVLVESGYSGGVMENPTYEQVCDEDTGHAEVVRITFNPQLITYTDLLRVFFYIHDPTTMNRQGNDIGEQYRSVIFYHNKNQHDMAIDLIKQSEKSGLWENIVTEISPYSNFYKAENYHQDYYNLNKTQPYCSLVIQPKLDKFKQEFKNIIN